MSIIVDNEPRTLGSRFGDALEAQISTDTAQQLSEALQLLGHPVRIQLLDVLAHHAGQVCVCDLEAAVLVKQPTVSHHLRLLREAGLIDAERHGQWIYYFLKREAVAGLRTRISAWLATLG